MIATTFSWMNVVSATFVRTNAVSAVFVQTPPEWLHEVVYRSGFARSTGVASPRVSPNVLPAIFVQSNALLAT